MRKTRGHNKIVKIIEQLVALEAEVRKLPELSPLEQAKLDHDRAIDDLYYSSKLEGTHLTHARIEQAIHA